MPIIEVRGASKYFPIYRRPSDRLKEWLTLGRRSFHEPFWALRDVDLEVEEGCCLGIIGENGSGKSTLLRLIAGVTRPTSGRVNVNGRVSALLELGAGFNGHFSGRENIYLNAAILGFTDSRTRALIPFIEQFAEIGDFIDLPVRTYSSGMFVRLAFAVAIHLDPRVLVVDEALAVGDMFFQQRCIRRIQQMKSQGVTIVFVSHDLEAVRTLADRALWMEHGNVALQGKTDEVVSRYLAQMISRGRSDSMAELPAGRSIVAGSEELDLSAEAWARIPQFISGIPNVDHRFGNGKARIAGVGIFGTHGDAAATVSQGDRICIRISVEFMDRVERPNIGFMLRNRLGQDVTGTNAMFEGEQLAAANAGDRVSLDFIMDLPYLQSGFYYFSPAVADGDLHRYEMCDWVDSACAIEVLERATTYGHMRVPMRVRPVAIERARVSG